MANELTSVDSSPIGSAGTLIAAGMEHAGLYLQSSLLDVVAEGPLYSIGGFLYTLGVATAIFLIATGGHYKHSRYLLIGPGLFFWILFDRVPTRGVIWQHGARVSPFAQVLHIVDHAAGDRAASEQNNIRVPRVFAVWDWLASGTTQTFIRALALVNPQTDLHFLQATQKYSALYSAEISDGEINDFVRIVSLHPTCTALYGLKFLNTRRKGDFSDSSRIEERIEQLEQTVAVSRSDPRWSYVQRLIDRNAFGSSTGEVAAATNLFCLDLWEYSIEALRSNARDVSTMLAMEDTPEGLSRTSAFQKLASKFDDPNGTIEDKVETMYRAVAGLMMLKALRKNNPATYQIMISDPILHAPPGGLDARPLGEELRIHMEAMEGRGKGQYLSSMLALPYIQGVILYFLSASFPFFCFCLLLPGRHLSFLLWMGLWLWVKLWDFGFAVVMLLDELLYYLLPRGPILRERDIQDPGSTLQILLQEDPLYSVHTYYLIMATLLGAVPLVTGIFVKKGGGEVVSAGAQAIDGFSGKIGGAMEAFHRSGMSSGLMAKGEKLEALYGQKAMIWARNHPRIQELKRRWEYSSLVSQYHGSNAQSGPLAFLQSAFNSTARGTRSDNEEYLKNRLKAEYEALWKSKHWEMITTDPEYRNIYNNVVMLGNANHRLWENWAGANARGGIADALSEDLVVARANYRGHGLVDGMTGTLSRSVRGSIRMRTTQAFGNLATKVGR